MSASPSPNRRSEKWLRDKGYYGFARRAWMRAQGLAGPIFDGRPVIGICNTYSELNPCHAHFRSLAEAVKRGVWSAGGVALEFPVISLGEMMLLPSAMLLRNLMAMDVEEMLRGNPIDGAVLLGACDKTIPALLMGAASAAIPALVVPGGPMLSGLWRNRRLGAGTDGRKLFDQYRTGALSEESWCEVECSIARSAGHCTVMGTASTMGLLAEALGMTLPGAGAIPAVDARRLALAEESGRRAVALVEENLVPARVLTRAALDNAIAVLMALGGSTNAVVHLLALAGRLNLPLSLEDFDRLSQSTPWLANIKPSGEYLMEDLFAAGGLPALLRDLLPLLHGDALTVNGRTLAENAAAAECWDREVLHPLDQPLHPEGGILVLRGNLCPRGALIKQTAASPHLLRHRGPAFVFENYDHMKAALDAPDLPVDERSVLVLKNGGPLGGPGFPEWGQIPMPRVLLARGVKDVVRISDARMSGTSFGTVVLHACPESAAGGPLAAVQSGDEIELDAPARSLTLCLPAAEIERRLRAFTPPPPHYTRGYGKLFLDHVLQADQGCDFDFLRAVNH